MDVFHVLDLIFNLGIFATDALFAHYCKYHRNELVLKFLGRGGNQDPLESWWRHLEEVGDPRTPKGDRFDPMLGLSRRPGGLRGSQEDG